MDDTENENKATEPQGTSEMMRKILGYEEDNDPAFGAIVLVVSEHLGKSPIDIVSFLTEKLPKKPVDPELLLVLIAGYIEIENSVRK